MKAEYPGSVHNHTHFSNLRLRDCIIREDKLIDYAIELGHSVLAITDHEALSCHIKAQKYYQKIKEKNSDFKLILGNEIYLCRDGLTKDNFISGQDRYYHFILLAKDEIGHAQLRELSTRAWKRSWISKGKMRRVPTYYSDLFEVIGANPGHLIGSTACLGGCLPTQIMRASTNPGNKELLERIDNWAIQLHNLFGENNFYLELQPSATTEQTYVNRKLIEMSERLDIPYIITTDSHYLKKEDAPIHEAFLNAQDGDREVKSFYLTTYMMSTEELESHLDLTEEELEKAYGNILTIRDNCKDYDLTKPLEIPILPWREFNPKNVLRPTMRAAIPHFKTFEESDFIGDKKLIDCIVEKVESDERLQNKETYDAIEDCLEKTWTSSIKNKTHWSSYYLNLQKIIDCCWDAGTLVGPGRGSGVGFILLYLCDITQINPLWETVQTKSWRFLNPDRVSVLDVDIDIEGSRRKKVLQYLRQAYGEDYVTNVATFGTEKPKSAILTAARGLGIDIDAASAIAALIPVDRGQPRSLRQCFYGDEEAGFAPVKQFVYEMTENYPELWEVALRIEGLVNRLGQHAGGVIFTDKPLVDYTALMRAPDGTLVTAYDLHDDEAVSLIKYDLLSIEGLDKIHNELDLLVEYGYITPEPTLKETYEKVVGIYNLERDNPDMWKMIWEHRILSLFQMEQQSGIQGIALTHPQSVDDLAHLNSVIRLMAQEKGAELPLAKYARFKNDINLWYDEMDHYGVKKEHQELLKKILLNSYGICEAQELFMELVQIPECGGFDLNWADRLRKSIAKKKASEFEALEKEYYAVTKEKGLDEHLCNYVWSVLVSTSRGYGFNLSHTLSYSLVALQEMNLAFRYPLILWDCACLINDAGGGSDSEEELEDSDSCENCYEEVAVSSIDSFVDEPDDDEDDEDDEDEEEVPKKVEKKKKKAKSSNYGKVATAIGKMREEGVSIAPPDINESKLTFSPDVENSEIRYGLTGITRVGADVVNEIIKNRPYQNLEDLLNRVKMKKPQVINLIKAGALDCFGDRTEIMHEYIDLISGKKKRITLQNMRMLIDFGLIPDEYDMSRRVFNYNVYLRKLLDDDKKTYLLNDVAFGFYEKNFDMDKLKEDSRAESGFSILKTSWKPIYDSYMAKVRPYVQSHNQELLKAVNDRLESDMWNKYCKGSLSKWEMDSVSFYSHPHELAGADLSAYNCVDYFSLPEEPPIETEIMIKGKKVPLYKIVRIAGTVLDRDKNKHSVTLLTTSGVVTVKIFGTVFAHYDKQISERGDDGKKHVIEKSWFARGSKIIVSGIRRGEVFLGKKYARTPWHLVEKIESVDEDGHVVVRHERAGDEEI